MNRPKIPRPERRGIFLIILTMAYQLSALSASETARFNLSAQAVNRVAVQAGTAIKILALRVSFEPDSNLSTSGNGQFLEAGSHNWCDGFLVDPAPHDVPYFYDQLQAVGNYFAQISHDQLTIDIGQSLVYPPDGDSAIVLNAMATYTTVEESAPLVDSLLVRLAFEAIDAIDFAAVNVNDYDMVIIFHAGLGQDFAYATIDPTPLDIPSSYIDLDMIFAAAGVPGIPLSGNNYYTRPVLLVPESQNHIYYDTAQDLFGYTDDLCGVQVGLTGTLALLMGYGLGFPPLFDTVTGDPGVGVFALMDVGSGNGRGIMPAPPDPWTRIALGWEEPVALTDTNLLAARHLPAGQIGKLTLSPSEYLLIENRSNWIGDEVEVDLDSLLYRNAVEINGYLELPPYFEYVTDSMNVTQSARGVIVGVENYDWGLPGSGLLIWQVNESAIPADLQGINNNRNLRGIRIIEADGPIHIGFPTSYLFTRPDLGWRWDMWFAGNDGFFAANPSLVYDNPQRLLMLDSQTIPALALQSGANTGYAIGPIGAANTVMAFAVGSDLDITWLPTGSEIIGHNGSGLIYQRNDSLWLDETLVDSTLDNWQIFVHEQSYLYGGTTTAFWLIDTTNSVYSANRYYAGAKTTVADTVRVYDAFYGGDKLSIIVEQTGEPPVSPAPQLIDYPAYDDPYTASLHSMGYLTTLTEYTVTNTSFDGEKYYFDGHSSLVPPVLADIDGDGLDEVLTIDDVALGQLGAFNWNGVGADDFPVYGNFEGPILAANMMGDRLPEIVVIESGDIAIYDASGIELMRFARRGTLSPFLHAEADRIGLVDGDRIIWFAVDVSNPFWLTETAQFSRERISYGAGIAPELNQDAMDKSRVYNYPNPVLGAETTIRFFVKTASSANIRFYTLDGLKVDEFEISDLHQNDYNEWIWNVSDLPAGLYYALVAVSGAETESTLIKIAVIK